MTVDSTGSISPSTYSFPLPLRQECDKHKRERDIYQDWTGGDMSSYHPLHCPLIVIALSQTTDLPCHSLTGPLGSRLLALVPPIPSLSAASSLSRLPPIRIHAHRSRNLAVVYFISHIRPCHLRRRSCYLSGRYRFHYRGRQGSPQSLQCVARVDATRQGVGGNVHGLVGCTGWGPGSSQDV